VDGLGNPGHDSGEVVQYDRDVLVTSPYRAPDDRVFAMVVEIILPSKKNTVCKILPSQMHRTSEIITFIPIVKVAAVVFCSELGQAV